MDIASAATFVPFVPPELNLGDTYQIAFVTLGGTPAFTQPSNFMMRS
jgi:hypothetical protein